MKTLDEYLKEFQQIYLEESGEDMSREEAYDNFISLVDILRIILQPLPEQSQGYQKPGFLSSPIDQLPEDDRLNNRND